MRKAEPVSGPGWEQPPRDMCSSEELLQLQLVQAGQLHRLCRGQWTQTRGPKLGSPSSPEHLKT